MTRRRPAPIAALAALCLLGGSAGPLAQAPGKVTPKVGMFTIIMRTSFNPIPKHLQLLDFWLPLPPENGQQKIFHRFMSGAYDAEVTELPDAMSVVAYMKGGPRGGLPMQSLVSFELERFEDLRNDFQPRSSRTGAAEREQLRQIEQKWIRNDRLAPIDRGVRETASKITSGKRKPLDKARAIYDHLVTSFKIVPNPTDIRGAGYGNLQVALREMRGDSVDMAAAFVGLCRAEGIPARTVIGLKIPERMTQGTIYGYHSWAEFHLEGVGWVPVDPAEAQRDASRRAYYFGALDERRLAISVGRDIQLVPPQGGEPLNYFINPYWEGDRQPMPSPWVEVTFEELKEIPNRPPPMPPPAPADPTAPANPNAPAGAAGKPPR